MLFSLPESFEIASLKEISSIQFSSKLFCHLPDPLQTGEPLPNPILKFTSLFSATVEFLCKEIGGIYKHN